MDNIAKPWALPAEQLLSEMKSSGTGLTEEEAKRRLAEHGYNEIAGKGRREGREILLSQLSNPLILVLIAAAAVAYLLGEAIDSIVILSIVLVNSILGFFQEYRAEKALAELKKYVTLRCKVLRDGFVEEIDSRELVIGDIVYLNIGDIVPADIRLLSVDELTTNEAALTGESMPVTKETSAADGKHATPQDIRNVAFMGTAIASGTGNGIVIAAGKETFFGKTAAYLKQAVHEGDFQKNIRKFSNLLLKVIIVMTVFVFAANALLGRGYFSSFLFAVALAVGITPEILPIIVTIALSNGAVRMAKEKVITKRLVSVEDLGNIDTLCCDKTGTLTEGELSLSGYFNLEGRPEDQIIVYGLLCNSTKAEKGGKSFGNPIDKAIWESERAVGLKTRLGKYPIIDMNELDFERRRMSVVVRTEDGNMLIAKGAPEAILSVCSSATVNGQQTKMSDELLSRIETTLELYECDGYRVIAIAEKPTLKDSTTKEDESDLNLIGFMLFIDPPKKTAKDSLKTLQKLGVKIKVLSGDSLLVTKKVCNEVGLCGDALNCSISPSGDHSIDASRVITGEELEKLDESEFEEYVLNYSFFARVTPEQKYRIVSSLRREGHIVGFLGDGINDVPALKAADVGITVDSATGIAKEEADIILLEKSLKVLADGIIQGRKTFGNITKYILNTISANWGNMLTVALSSLFLPFIPLLPSQILLNNFMSDLPMLTVSTDNVDEDLLKKPRRWNLGLISHFMLYFGIISSIFDLLFILPLMFFFHASTEIFRTGWFLESILSEIIVMFAIRTKKPFFASRPSKWLILSSVIVIMAAVGITFTDFGAKYFQFTTLPGEILAFIAAILLLYLITAEVAKNYFFKKFDL
jgi:Mg2+-importing ATPase